MLVIVKIIFLKTCYTEKHHIIPKCLNGNNSKENLVIVSTKEHYLLHHLLTKIYPENRGLKKAFKMLRNRLHIDRTSSPYSCIRKCDYKAPLLSEEHKQKISESERGKIVSDETKRKLSKSHKGKTLSDEHKRKIAKSCKGEKNGFYGKTHSEEAKQKMSESAKNRTGKILVNNGIINKRVFPNEIPEGFVKGKIKKVH